MNDRTSRSSQVGLFSEQISEQIGRLRVLTGTDADRAGGIALKRAVMATRLLAGSARILHAEELTAFLEELLAWLQGIGQTSSGATPTQSLILDAVIAFEEGLMRRLDRPKGLEDLSAFHEEIDELLKLIRKNQASLPARPPAPSASAEVPGPPPEAQDEPPGSPPEAQDEPPGPPPEAQDEPPGPSQAELEDQIFSAVGTLADWLDGLEDHRREELLGRGVGHRQLRHLRAALDRLLGPSADPESAAHAIPASTIDSDHPLVHRLARCIQAHASRLQGGLQFRIEGDPGDLAPERGEKLLGILDRLVGDTSEVLAEMFQEDDAPSLAHLSVVFEQRDDRLRIAIRDDGPSLGASPALDHADPLGLYRGLRGSRSAIEELHGIILVEPEDHPGTRFVLSLPVDVSRPVVRLLDLGRVEAAVSGFLLDEVISTEGLLFHRDTDGEHFMRNGRPVPLVDLAEYVPGLEPLAEEAGSIAIVGSVEKRLGIYCHGVGGPVDSSRTGDPPPQWQRVSRYSIQIGDKAIPLLSVERLLRLRMTVQLVEEAGSVPDPLLDVYLPGDEESPEATAGATGTAGEGAEPAWAAERVLLVNQSQFRRRDLERALAEAGYAVTAVETLEEGRQLLQAAEYGLLVTDLRLGEEGAVGLSDLRKIRPHLKVVLTSSVAREYAEELARRVGADACWLQPYRREDLLRVLPAPR